MKTVTRVVILVVAGAGLVVGALAYKAHQRDATGREALTELLQELAALEMDAQSHGYVDGLARSFHDAAFDRAFERDGWLTGGTIDVNRYQRLMLDEMIGRARGDASPHIVAALEEHLNTARLDLTGG